MSAHIVFMGSFFSKEFSSVEPQEIILSGKRLTISGTLIPVGELCLFKAHSLFAYYSNYPKATIKVVIEMGGTLQYYAECYPSSVSKLFWKIVSIGDSKNWESITPGKFTPRDDYYAQGDDPEVLNFNFRYPW